MLPCSELGNDSPQMLVLGFEDVALKLKVGFEAEVGSLFA